MFAERVRVIVSRLAVVLLLGGGLMLGYRNLRRTLSQQSPRSYRDRSETLLIPSPLESSWLSSDEHVWPELYNPDLPPRPANLPRLYTLRRPRDVQAGLADADRERARYWSVLAASENVEALRADLSHYAKPFELTRARNPVGERCHVMDLELVFRWAQVDPTLEEVAASRLRACRPDSVLIPWLEFRAALRRQDRASLHASYEALRSRGLKPGQGWTGWFASEAARVAQRLQPSE